MGETNGALCSTIVTHVQNNEVLALTFVGQRKPDGLMSLLLKLRPDGTCWYDSQDDVRYAADVFWQRATLADRAFGTPQSQKCCVVDIRLGTAGIRFYQDGVYDYFGGYAPDDKTRAVIETIVKLRPR